MDGGSRGNGHVSYGEFSRLDLRVAVIKSAEPIPGRTRILRGVVDLGGGDERTAVIGGAEHYAPADLAGRTVVVVANLEPRSLAGVESEAMLLAADVDGKPHWLTVDGAVQAGSPVR